MNPTTATLIMPDGKTENRCAVRGFKSWRSLQVVKRVIKYLLMEPFYGLIFLINESAIKR